MRSLHHRSTPPSMGAITHRSMQVNPGSGDLSDPFARRPIYRAIVLMALSVLPLLIFVWLFSPVSPVLLTLIIFPAFTLWPYCLAVICLCLIEQSADWAKRRWRPSIDELHIAPRLVRMLRRHGYSSIADIEGVSDQILLLIPNLDPRGLREIRRAIHLRHYQEWQAHGFPSGPRPG